MSLMCHSLSTSLSLTHIHAPHTYWSTADAHAQMCSCPATCLENNRTHARTHASDRRARRPRDRVAAVKLAHTRTSSEIDRLESPPIACECVCARLRVIFRSLAARPTGVSRKQKQHMQSARHTFGTRPHATQSKCTGQ